MSSLFSRLPQSLQTQLLEKCQGKRLVLPEADDERVQEAASRLQEEVGVKCVLVTREQAQTLRIQVESHLESVAKERGRELKPQVRALAAEPLMTAGYLLARGEADAAVAGAVHDTGSVIRAILATIGLRPGVSTLTSAFLMALERPTPGGEDLLVFGDAGVVPQPSSEQLVDIAKLCSDAFGDWTQRVSRTAFLSFSTHGSAQHEDTAKVDAAARAFQEKFPERCAFGEVQFDAATVPEIAQRKLKRGDEESKGRCNVFVFPDLDAGNICYKAAERLAGAHAWGPVVLGSRLPFSDLSRGCSASDIVHVGCLTLALC